MRVAVIGTGYWGRKHVVELAGLGHDVTACDFDESKLSEFKDLENVSCLTDYKKVLSDSSIKAVTICAPNAFHFDLAKQCLASGKHVLVEKPLTESVEDADTLIALATERKLVLSVGHIYRFNNAIDKVKELVSEGFLGQIRVAKIQWSNDEYAFQPDFHTRVGDRDVLTDLGVHAFDILHYIFECNPSSVMSYGRSYTIADKIESILITGDIRDGLFSVELSWVTPPKTRSLIVVGERRSLFVDCVSQTIDVFEKGDMKRLDVEPNNTIGDELAYFLSLTEQEGLTNKASGEVGRNNIRLLTYARDSLEKKSVVAVTD